LPVEEIQLGVRNGVGKIDGDTDNRLAITGAIRKVFIETPEKFDRATT
jgi:fructose-bisphosphate aldolase class II